MFHICRWFVLESIILGLWAITTPMAAAVVIWNGPSHTFEKLDNADWQMPENQDRITDQVWITRRLTRPLFNAAVEFSDNETSPTGTRWAFQGLRGNPNDASLITASNFEELTFDTFVIGLESSIGSNIVDRPGVLHLVEENAYLDVVFTSWTLRSGGGFRYERSTPPTDIPSVADYNQDGSVNLEDYSTWKQNFGNMAPGGGDGNGDGSIDAADFTVWRDAFSESSTADTSEHVIPEPTSIALMVLSMFITAIKTSPRAGVPALQRGIVSGS